MRTLLLLRGAMGSGKSTFIKENGLEPYTLEADRFRTLICNPQLNEEGNWHITQRNDTQAWNMLLSCLEERMQRGDFTVIDATHNSPKLVKKYVDLADHYKYSIFYYQPETTLEECIERNAKRDQYKFVPVEAIKRAYTLIQNVDLPSRFKRIYSLSEIDNFYIPDITEQYEQVKVIGDIQGCYTVLKDAIGEIDPKTLYVFVGDYLDRGIENKEVLDYILSIQSLPNVVQLEGNHEAHLVNWAKGLEVKSRYFLRNTLPELVKGLDEDQVVELKKDIRKWWKQVRQCYAFNFHNQKYLVTHGGLTSVPKLTYISTEQMVKGVGNYETNVGELYQDNYLQGKCQDFIQLHGHRGVESSDYSYCLESEVEFGGHLSIGLIQPNKPVEILQYQNTVFKVLKAEEQQGDELDHRTVENEQVNKMLSSRLVKSKACDHNLISINFSRMAFKKKAWNDMTIKARGLFVDKVSGEVKLRSFEKFFNYQELTGTTDKRSLQANLKFPVKLWLKENGYLGILSVIDDKFVFATKSVINSEYVDWFKELFYTQFSMDEIELIKQFITENNCSLVFEVITKHDPHIIKYDEDKLVLLQAIKNQLEYETVDYTSLFFVTSVEPKWLVDTVDGWESLEKYFKLADQSEIEGYVIEDQTGFMFKYKGKYYSDWKRRRGLADLYKRTYTSKFPFARCLDTLDVEFMTWLTKQPIEKVIDKGIIELRDMYYNQ